MKLLDLYNLYMTILEAYTSDFDSYENVVNGGMNGKVFVTTAPNCTKEYKSLSEALLMHADSIDQIILYYQKDGEQLFKKLELKSN